MQKQRTEKFVVISTIVEDIRNMSSIEINTSDSDNDLKFATYNIHSRPKRTTQFNPINLNSLDTIILEESDESEDEDFLPNEESSEDIVNEPENCETNTDVDLASKQTKKLLKTENAKKMPAEEPTTTVKKKRKYKKRKQQPFLVDPQSDEETKKILNSFRNAKLGENLKSKSAKLLPKSKLTTKKTKLEKLPDTTLFPDPDLTCQPKVYAGPYIRCVTSSAAPMFMVYQSHSAHDSKFDVEAKKGMTIREKAPPITDQTIPWICSLCHTRPHSINGIGSLFGPYRVSLSELEEDQTLEYRTGNPIKNSIVSNRESGIMKICDTHVVIKKCFDSNEIYRHHQTKFDFL